MAKVSAQLSPDGCEIELFYSRRYKNGRDVVTPDAHYVEKLERAINDTWYELGLYEKRGHDFYGITYRQSDDEWGGGQTYKDFCLNQALDNRHQ
jgi:hypothetical protein